MQTEMGIVLKDMYERSLAGEITKKDARGLLKANPFELFDTADALRKEIVGDVATYVVNRNINFTDQCTGTCRFCSFRNSIGFKLTIPQILKKVDEAKQLGATEVCIQGGLQDDMGLQGYVDIIKAIKAKYDIHTHAFSPMEVYHMSKVSGVTVDESLKALKAAGLNSMPGTAAEILSDDIREQICPDKLTTAEWVDVVTKAHRTGIPTTATIMYGHIETWEHRLDHLFIIRDIQRKTHGITEFVPLSFMYENNSLTAKVNGRQRYRRPAHVRYCPDHLRPGPAQRAGKLGQAGREAGAGGPVVRCQRPRRHDHGREHLEVGRGEVGRVPVAAGAADDHPRSRAHPTRAHHAVQAT